MSSMIPFFIALDTAETAFLIDVTTMAVMINKKNKKKSLVHLEHHWSESKVEQDDFIDTRPVMSPQLRLI